MIPLWILQLLTQISWVLSLITLPLTGVGFLYAKWTGQIVFRVKEGPSLFEQKKPNPAFSPEDKLSFEEEQKKFFGLDTSPQQPSSASHKATPETESPEHPLIWTPESVAKSEKLESPSPPPSPKTTNKNEDPQPSPFQCTQKVFEAKTSEEFRERTKEGIPFVIAKDTPIQVAVSGALEDLPEGSKDKKVLMNKKLEDLEKDEYLGDIAE